MPFVSLPPITTIVAFRFDQAAEIVIIIYATEQREEIRSIFLIFKFQIISDFVDKLIFLFVSILNPQHDMSTMMVFVR